MNKISRRLLTSGIGVSMLPGLSALNAAKAETRTLRISHQWRQNTDARDKAARMFADEASKLSPDLKFRIYPNRSLISNPVAQYDAMLNGSLEMAVFPITYGVGKVPEFSIGIMPGTVRSVDQAMKLKNTPFHDRLQQVAMAGGIRIVTWWWTPGGFASRDKPVTGPDSVEGMRMRAADPTFELMLKDAGASVVSMPSTEIYPAMQSGVLNATLTSAETFVSMRIYEQTKYATIGGPNTLWMLLQPLVMARTTWESLSPDQQKAIETAADMSNAWFAKEQKTASADAETAFKKSGNEVHHLTNAEYAAWVALAKRTAWQAFAKDTAHGKELLELLNTSLS